MRDSVGSLLVSVHDEYVSYQGWLFYPSYAKQFSETTTVAQSISKTQLPLSRLFVIAVFCCNTVIDRFLSLA